MAYGKIYDLILSGKKLPGTRLILNDLEKELNIGRGPIREALMRLDRSGLVQNLPYRGAVVAPLPSFREMEQIFLLRIELESFLAQEAMQKIQASALLILEEILLQMQNFSSQDFLLLDRQFHVIIYEASEMPHLCMMAEKIFETVAVFLRIQHPDKQVCIDSMDEHYTILNALKTKNYNMLTDALASNIRRGLLEIRRSYANSHYNAT